MSSEEELRILKESIKEKERGDLRRARITILVLAAAAVISVLFMFYGFKQSIEAQKQIVFQIEISEKCARELEEAKKNFRQAQLQAEAAQFEAAKQRQIAQEAVAKAKFTK